MEKIKKLELPLNDPRRGIFNTGAGNIQIIRKINEIIDRLNEQPEESLVESVERKYKIDLGVDKDTKLEDLLKQKGLPSMSETLKDTTEEWEKDIRGLLWRMKYSNTKDYYEKKYVEELISKVKQLLEEREEEARKEGFSEEELDFIRVCIEIAEGYHGSGSEIDEEKLERLYRKISKLKKEK